MKFVKYILLVIFLCNITSINAQNKEQEKVIKAIIKEATENSQLEALAHHLLDVIGPRLVGTPQMKHAHEWVAETYNEWGMDSRIEHWGEWQAWNRGITHIDMLEPRVQSLRGTQLAWSPSTTDNGVKAGIVVLPQVKDSLDFEKWLPSVKGKFVLISQKQITGRPDYNWEEFATEESLAKMQKERDSLNDLWRANIKRTGFSNRWGSGLSDKGLLRLEEAGAMGLISSYWSKGFGAHKIFSSYTKYIPTVNLDLEDYTMLYRMVEHGNEPIINIVAKSEDLGRTQTFNSFGEIKGDEMLNNYVMLSAHLDSVDGATGATDNGTGTIIMMEVMRILNKVVKHPKRTILAGHWGSEEQGLNGSRAFVKDHPEIVSNLQALFNQDNGTGRIIELDGHGFLYSYEFLTRWLNPVPKEITDEITTIFPGDPNSRGSSDHKSFVAAGAPGFRLRSLDWAYSNYTWHTDRDTYDKIVFDDVRNNVILTAILVYMASEDEKSFPKDKRIMPLKKGSDDREAWPEIKDANRNGRNN